MELMFYLSGLVALAATVRVVTHSNAVHALLYLIVSLLALALAFYALGAPFAAALEVIVYAGAIMVLFVFAMMLLNLGAAAAAHERAWLAPRIWLGPAALALILLLELAYVLAQTEGAAIGEREVDAKAVGTLLFGPYLLAVELASLLLLAALVGAYHIGRRLDEGDDERGGEIGGEAGGEI